MKDAFPFRRTGAAIRRTLIAFSLLGTGGAMAETLKFGNEGVYPPFSILSSDGKLTGVEPDLAREMCKRMKVECEVVAMDFKALIPSLLQGKFDGITTQLSPTPERKEKLAFGIPLFLNPGTFVVPKSSSYTFTKAGLAGKGIKLGVQRGSSMVKYSEAMLGDSVAYVFYDNPDQMKLDLLAGRINAVFDSKINWTLELISKPEGKDWKLDGGDHWTGDPSVPEAERGYSWVVKKGDEALLKRMDAALTEMIKDCTYTTIRKKYLDITTLPAEAHCVK
ncbi:transporter substrate-binding domain-containing protein [Methyloraptor flagellatus]|uniref:Transporter substrate-binding domain-containing protein n=1 Tax=Methyloraptor flagellatus TaxID=3162530 RepID=A0AAU7X7U3_9HYPH